MTDQQWLAERFEEHRFRLRAVAYRMLGSLSEADDAVQDAWLRVSRADTSEIDNLGAWLTTIVARIALNMLRSRSTRREQPFDVHLPDPIVDPADGTDPEHEALLVDSVGLALLVVLETLSPAERLAFVLHDMFAVPFEQIATLLERTPEAARQLASRARRRVRGSVSTPDTDLDAQWKVVDAFLAAARNGDFEALVAVLDPDVELRADGGLTGLSHYVRGAEAVASQAKMWARVGLTVRRALVNGAAGLVSERDGEPFSVGAFTIRDGKIVECDFLVDPERLAQLDLELFQDGPSPPAASPPRAPHAAGSLRDRPRSGEKTLGCVPGENDRAIGDPYLPDAAPRCPSSSMVVGLRVGCVGDQRRAGDSRVGERRARWNRDAEGRHHGRWTPSPREVLATGGDCGGGLTR